MRTLRALATLFALVLVSAPAFAGSQSVTVSGATGNLTPVAEVVYLTCAHTSTCAITLVPAPRTVPRKITIVCLTDGTGGPACGFSQQDALLSLPTGGVTLGNEDVMELMWDAPRQAWHRVAGSDNVASAATPTPTNTPVPTATPTPTP